MVDAFSLFEGGVVVEGAVKDFLKKNKERERERDRERETYYILIYNIDFLF